MHALPCSFAPENYDAPAAREAGQTLNAACLGMAPHSEETLAAQCPYYQVVEGIRMKLAGCVQGSTLVPENLKRVAASWASSIIVVSDCSRYWRASECLSTTQLRLTACAASSRLSNQAFADKATHLWAVVHKVL